MNKHQRAMRRETARAERVAALETGLRNLLDAMETPRTRKAAVAWDAARALLAPAAPAIDPALVGVEVETVNYSGHRFDSFHVGRETGLAPGWFVLGRNAEKYGRLPDGRGAYVALCARPDVKPRVHPHYNGRVRRGWHLKREAQAVADALNQKSI